MLRSVCAEKKTSGVYVYLRSIDRVKIKRANEREKKMLLMVKEGMQGYIGAGRLGYE